LDAGNDEAGHTLGPAKTERAKHPEKSLPDNNN
jgi:hypothetical protein